MLDILLTNDDGIDSPGLACLRQALEPFGRISTIAPLRNQSAVARGITIGRPLNLSRASFGGGFTGVAVEGTPVDCVRVALIDAVAPPPHLVVSGVNLGANMGNDVGYSGTVGAVLEAALRGVPGIAFSIESRTPAHLHRAGPVLAAVVRRVLEAPLPAGVVLNVNLPDRPPERLAGLRVTSLGGASRYDVLVLAGDDGLGGRYAVSCEREAQPETVSDFDAVAAGYVSLTPLENDLLSRRGLGAMRDWPPSLADMAVPSLEDA